MRTLFAACAILSTLAAGRELRAAAPAGGDPVVAPRVARDAQADTGFLDIASDPPATIAIDGNDTGKVTPQPRLELKAGHHKLTLVTLDGAHARTIGFTVEAGQTTKLTIHLAS